MMIIMQQPLQVKKVISLPAKKCSSFEINFPIFLLPPFIDFLSLVHLPIRDWNRRACGRQKI